MLRQKMLEIARVFRKEPTPSEAILWKALRREQVDGRKFRRQQPIGPFIVDFFCPAERLIVEVDGGVHESQRERDGQRQELLETLGLRFVRISSEQVEQNLSAAIATIRRAFTPEVAVLPSPLVGDGPGERGTARHAPASATSPEPAAASAPEAPR